MAKLVTAFADNMGCKHDTAQEAAVSDLMVVLGRIGGAQGGITEGLAKCIIEKRAEIEAVFADLDRMNPILPEAMQVQSIGGEHHVTA